MARPKSDDKRNAILSAAARVIVAQGLSAPTARIAREAGISNGSLFTYFETKADLFNQLYLELKLGMAGAAMKGFPDDADLRTQAFHVWFNWMNWATGAPEKRKALLRLGVSDLITPESRAAVMQVMARFLNLMEQMRDNGPLRDAPMTFVSALMTTLGETTMDFMIKDRANAKTHCVVGFETFWRAIS